MVAWWCIDKVQSEPTPPLLAPKHGYVTNNNQHNINNLNICSELSVSNSQWKPNFPLVAKNQTIKKTFEANSMGFKVRVCLGSDLINMMNSKVDFS